ncbi:MAG TPA: hypothetical protein VLS44_00525 [Nitrospira sp.]|nr:hypothetical protein [Nitrospira sp.]
MRYPDRLRFGFVSFILLGGLWSLPGQALEPVSSNPPPLNEKELLPYKLKGHGSLTGQAFLGSPSGKGITQAGVPVHLIPITSYTRSWFERHVRTSSCGSHGDRSPGESAIPSRPPSECVHDSLVPLLAEKRLTPYIRTTRANPTGHFWFTKIPAGRYYIVSLIEGGAGSHQEERAAGIAWLLVDLEAGAKETNLVVTDCKSNLC